MGCSEIRSLSLGTPGERVGVRGKSLTKYKAPHPNPSPRSTGARGFRAALNQEYLIFQPSD